LECGGNFAQHLFNGDPLSERTTHVPRGMPHEGAPPFTWKESAIAAVRYDGLDKVEDWSIERILYQLEGYNGWGYEAHHRDVNTPYLWSGTTHYSRGKYVADGEWSSDAVSGQSGAAAILHRCMELDGDVRPALESYEGAHTVEDGKTGAEAFPKAVPPPEAPGKIAAKSPTTWVAVALGGMWSHLTGVASDVTDSVSELFGAVPKVASDTQALIAPSTDIIHILGAHSREIEFVIGLVCLTVVVIRNVHLHGKVPR
jgi:hypothetical protein